MNASRFVESILRQGRHFYGTRRKFASSSFRCKAHVIDGRAMACEIQKEIRTEVDEWVARGNRRPHLCAVLVGDDPASHVYVRNKMRAADYTGISSETIRFPDTISEPQLLAHLTSLTSDPTVDGVIVQLPLPPHISEAAACAAIDPAKDVDGFHVVNVGRFCVDMKSLVPCTSAGVIEMIRRSGIETCGKNAVVCGRSKNVGLPIAMLLHSSGVGKTGACDCTTTICHRHTPRRSLDMFVKSADILVVATGIPRLITADMVKDGVAVIDVGINRIRDERTGKYKLVGDVDFQGVSEKASYISPVPGGVGPMTVAMLMKNTLSAARGDVQYAQTDRAVMTINPQTEPPAQLPYIHRRTAKT